MGPGGKGAKRGLYMWEVMGEVGLGGEEVGRSLRWGVRGCGDRAITGWG